MEEKEEKLKDSPFTVAVTPSLSSSVVAYTDGTNRDVSATIASAKQKIDVAILEAPH
jgi:hypothetical protein